ncbi:MAG: carboxypeptidase regulatory-like domain-containing protein [Muribaculaceae bacterium]
MNISKNWLLWRLGCLLAAVALCCAGVNAKSNTSTKSKGLKGKVIYVNAGHGGWTANDRPLATINHEVMDTLGFFETKTNLWKALELCHKLRAAGAQVVMSRTKNGYVTRGQANATPLDRVETDADENSQQQIVGLERIACQVDSLNPDYFISIHSNAHKDGSPVNYLVLMYRGETGKEYAPGSIERAQQAFPYIWDNPLSSWTSSSPEDPYIAGDITWMGGTAPGKANKLGYTGFLQVLKHRVPCFLAEGSFHSYQPERHRLLNRDYCRMEGVRYYRAINAYFGGKPEKTGYIVGELKDAVEIIDHPLFNYQKDSFDRFRPINGAMVYLVNDKGVTFRAYHTDGEWNGVFVFDGVKPGRYTLRIEAYGYHNRTEQITVEPDRTTYVKSQLRKIITK